MPSKRARGQKPQSLVVIRKGKTAVERERIAALYDALQTAAEFAGFPNYQEMTVHFWERVAARAVMQLDGYAAVDEEIAELVQRFKEAARHRWGSGGQVL